MDRANSQRSRSLIVNIEMLRAMTIRKLPPRSLDVPAISTHTRPNRSLSLTISFLIISTRLFLRLFYFYFFLSLSLSLSPSPSSILLIGLGVSLAG